MYTRRYLIPISLLLLLALAGCSSGDGNSDPTNMPAAAPEPSPTLGMVGGVAIQAMAVGPAFAIPDGVALLIEIGCTQCDGPTEGIERVYRDSEGQVQREVLFSAPTMPAYISSLAVSEDGQGIALTICSPGYCGGLAPVTEDATTTLHLSRDGGETWEVADVLDGAYFVQAVLDQGVLMRDLPAGDFSGWGGFGLYPGGEPIVPPEPDAWPSSISATELVWRTVDGRLLRNEGMPLVELNDDYAASRIAHGVLRPGPEGGYAIRIRSAADNVSEHYLAVFSPQRDLTHVFALSGLAGVSAWLPTGEALGNSFFSIEELSVDPETLVYGGAGIPTVFDFEAGIRRPIIDPFLGTFGRHRVLAAVPWP